MKSKQILSILLQLVVAGLVIIFTAYLLPGIVVDDLITGILIAALLALLNVTIKPILIFSRFRSLYLLWVCFYWSLMP